MKRVFILAIGIFVVNILHAQPGSDDTPKVAIDGLLYKLYDTNHTAMVANGNSWKGDLFIPEQVTYDGQTYSVDKIEWSAFSSCTTLTKVVIPKTVTDILHYGGYDACKNPFMGCTNLESIEVDEANPAMCSVDGILFSKDKSCIYCYPAGAKATTYRAPETVTWIGCGVFAYNTYLREVEIPNSVQTIEFQTFESCKNLESVKLSDNLTYLASSTFDKCESLRVIDIPQSVSKFAENVFRWTNLDALVVRGTFSGELRADTFYFVSDSMVIYAQSSEISKFKKVFSGTVLPLENYTAIHDIPSTSTINSKWSNGKCYDLSGRRLSAPPARGVYIEDGRKKVAY